MLTLQALDVANFLIKESKLIVRNSSLSMLRRARELSRVSLIIDLSLFLIILSLLNDRSPEQFVAIIERPMRNAMSTLGNVC